MKLREIKDKVELQMSTIGFTELLDTQNTIDVSPINQYQLKNIKQVPSIDYDDYKFDLNMNFESNEQMYDLFDATFQFNLKNCFEINEIGYDDINNIVSLKCHIIW